MDHKREDRTPLARIMGVGRQQQHMLYVVYCILYGVYYIVYAIYSLLYAIYCIMYRSDANSTSLSILCRTLKYHEPKYSFRTNFEYNNYMYVLAGHIAEKLTGESWEDLIESRIFRPLGMATSTFVSRIKNWNSLASSYTSVDDELRVVDKTLTRYSCTYLYDIC